VTDAGAMGSVGAGAMWSVDAGGMCRILGIILPLRGPSYKLRLARFSARLKLQDGPSVAKWRGNPNPLLPTPKRIRERPNLFISKKPKPNVLT
jgi:hypothetical protein